jgi:hypothetical protein
MRWHLWLTAFTALDFPIILNAKFSIVLNKKKGGMKSRWFRDAEELMFLLIIKSDSPAHNQSFYQYWLRYHGSSILGTRKNNGHFVMPSLGSWLLLSLFYFWKHTCQAQWPQGWRRRFWSLEHYSCGSESHFHIEIEDSNPKRDMNYVYVFLFCAVLYGYTLATRWPPSRESH